MNTKAVVVDDDQGESTLLVRLLNGQDELLQCEAIRPKDSVEQTAEAVFTQIRHRGPRVLLLDYRLGEHAIETGSTVTYRGGTVAGYVRDEDPDLPIVLLTSEEKLHEWVERRPGMKEHFDWTLLKNEIAAEDGGAAARAKLVDYATAWHKARGGSTDAGATWQKLGKLMAAPSGAMNLFSALEPTPPRGDVPGEVMKWLLRSAHRVSGPLIDDAEVRVMLGVTKDSFDAPKLQRWLQPARYVGALRTFGDRWWAHLVRELVAEACGGTRPVESPARAAALKKVAGAKLQAEGCNWCGGERTLHACMVCHAATDGAHCLRPLSEPLPAWADPAVICYRCIAVGRAQEKGFRFPPSVADVVDGLIENRIQPQT
jgi:hypothetical protein